MCSRLLPALLAALASVLVPVPGAAAQCVALDPPCEDAPPFVAIRPFTGEFASSALAVTVEWADDRSVNTATRSIRLNGVGVDHLFTLREVRPLTLHESSGTVPLSPGANTLVASVCDHGHPQPQCDTATAVLTYTPPPPPEPYAAPMVSAAPHHPGLLPPSPIEAAASYTTPAYVSLDVPRSVTLLYVGRLAQPRAFVQVDATDRSSNAPSVMSIRVRSPGGAWATPETFSRAGPGANRLAVAWTPPSGVGADTFQVVVRTYWADGTVREAPPVRLRVLWVDGRESPYGRGWGLAGMQRVVPLADGSVVIAEGDGTAVFFARQTATAFASPEGEFSTLVRDDTSFTRRYPDRGEAVFHGDGRLRSVRDRFGNRTGFEYDAAPRLARIVDPLGHAITLGYDANGRLRAITDPGGRTVTVGVTPAGDLTTITGPDGGVDFAATYDAQGRLRTRRGRSGGPWSFAYDAWGLLAADTLPAVAVEGMGESVRPVLRYRSWEASLLAAAPADTAPRRDPAALRAALVSPAGDSTRVALGRYLQPVRVEGPLGDTAVIEHDADGLPVSVTGPTGARTTYEWDGWRPTRVHDVATGRITTVSYGFLHDLPTSVTSGGVTVRHAYDVAGALARTVVGTDTTTYGHDARGRLLWSRDPEGHRSELQYEPGWGNLQSSTDTDANGRTRTTSFGYDAYGRATSVTDSAGTARVAHDLLNRDTASVDAQGRRTRLAYQGGFLHRVTDASGKSYAFHRNALGWVEREVRSAGDTLRYGYDLEGNLARRVDRRGRALVTTYDAAGRPMTRAADGAVTTFAYGPPRDPWVAAANAESVDSVFFDARGRPVRRVSVMGGQRYELRSEWLKEGPRSALRVIAPWRRTVWYRHDNALRLYEMEDSLSAAPTQLAYDGDGLPQTLYFPNGRQEVIGYTRSHLPQVLQWVRNGAGSPLDLVLGYDALDRVRTRANAAGDTVREYGYDALDRLTSHRDVRLAEETYCPDPWDLDRCFDRTVRTVLGSASYGYDAVGNRTDSGAVLEAAGNRYSQFAGFALEYDAEGNLTRKWRSGFDQRLYWNALGQLDSVVTNGVKVGYGYNGFGERVRRTEGGAAVRSLYDGEDLLMEVDGSGRLLREYLHWPGTDRPHSVRVWTDATTSAIYYYAQDHPGSVIGLFDAGGAVANTYRYTPWGRHEAGFPREAVSQPLRFMAREQDARTGLYYLRNRWYDPDLGRFVSEDPIGLEGGINLYAYAANDPVNLRDPFGLQPEPPISTFCERMHSKIENPALRRERIEWCTKNGVAGMGERKSSVRGAYEYTPRAPGSAMYCGGSMCYAPPVSSRTPVPSRTPGGWGSTGDYPNTFVGTPEQTACAWGTVKVIVGTTLATTGWGGVRATVRGGALIFRGFARGGLDGALAGGLTGAGFVTVVMGLDDIAETRKACEASSKQPTVVGYQ